MSACVLMSAAGLPGQPEASSTIRPTTATTPAPPVPTTLPPVVAVDSQEGFALWSWSAGGYATPEAGAAFDSLVEVGADSVAFVPLYYVDTIGSSVVRADPWVTADAPSLRAGIAAAKARGLRVTVRPLVDVRDGSWRGDISPVDPVSWFATYRAILRDLASISAELGVEQFVVGTELNSLSVDTVAWRGAIRDVRDRFAGTVTYAALPFEWSHIAFWDALDIIGINAWSKLSDQATTDVAALTRAWERELDRYEAAANQWRKPVLITEAGFTTQQGTATAPWRWDLSAVYAPDEQDAGYRALLAAMADEDWLIGVHWWAWRVTDRSEPLDFTPQGTVTEESVRAAWR